MSDVPTTAPSSEGAAFDRLRGVFDQLPAAVALVTGPDHVYEFVNAAYRRLLGDRDFEGRTVEEAVPELREQGFVELLTQVYRSGERFVGRESKITLLHGEGTEEVYVDFIYQPIRGSDGEVEAILGVGVDVTEAVSAREQLTDALRREQEDRFREAIDSMIDTVVIAEPVHGPDGEVVDLRVTFANSGDDEVGRRDRDELVGRRFTELWPNAEASGLLDRYFQVLASGEPLDLEDHEYAERVGGRDVVAVFDIRASRVGSELVLVFRDVTERAARERALVDSRARLAKEHEVVLQLQSALLPRELPHVEGVDIAAEYVAATDGVEVGGDWFDSFVLPDARLAICVGDVAGKGIAAAQSMAQLRSAGRVAALAGQGPSEVMASKNALMGMGGLGPLATTVFACYDPASGEVTWTSAGHLPPVHVPADGPPVLLPTPGQPPLGVVADVAFELRVLQLEPGDRLVLYTDGLVERRDEGLDDGLARLLAVVPAGADAATTCRVLLEELAVPAGRPDDICVVTLHRTA